MQITRHIFGPVVVYTAELEQPGDASTHGDDRHRREREAVQALVRHAFGPGIALEHRADGSPWIEAFPGQHISVSHSRGLAVLAVAPMPVGVDVEDPRPTLLRVAGRFLSEAEHQHYSTLPQLLEAWTLKEAAFKALRPGIPATAMPLPPAECPYTIIYSGPHPDFGTTHLAVVTAGGEHSSM